MDGSKSREQLLAEIEQLRQANRELAGFRDSHKILMGSGAFSSAILLDNLLVDVNDAFARLLGYRTPADLIGKSMDVIIPAQRRALAGQRIREVIDKRSANYSDVQMLCVDESLIDVEVIAFTITLKGSLAVQIVLRDIRKRKAVEKTLLESENRYKALVENAPFCLHELDLEGRLIGMNRSGTDMLGVTGFAELAGMAYLDFADEEDAPRIGKLFEQALAGRSSDFEFRGRGDDALYYSSNFVPIHDGDGNIVRIMGISQNITERRKMEQELIDRELQFRQITENMDEVFWLAKPGHTGLIYVSPGLSKIWGITPEQLFANPNQWSDFLHPQDRERVIEAVHTKQVLGTYDERYRIRRPDGEVRWVRERAYPVRDLRGDIYRITGIVLDITQREQAMEAQRVSENRLKQIIDLVPNMIFAKDEQGQYVLVNQAAAAAYGKTKEEMLGLNHREVHQSSEELDHMLADDQKVIRTGKPMFIPQEPFTFPSGRQATLQVSKIPFSDAGQPAVLGIAIDITESKKAEERNRALLEGIPDEIFVYDAEGLLLDYHGSNPELMVCLGQERKITEVLPEEAALQLLTGIGRVLKTGRMHTLEYKVPFEEGGTDYEARLVFCGEKSVLSIVRDLTRRKRMEAEREQLEAQLRHTQKLETIGTLAGGIAHDFNNMLSPILGFTELALIDLNPAEEAHGYLENVAKAAQRAKHLVHQILTFSHTETKQERKRLAMGSVIMEAFQMLRASLPATIDLETRIQTAEDIISGDPTQIHQVIVNLCANSRQAIGNKNGSIIISLDRVEVDQVLAWRFPNLRLGTWLRLMVNDTGCGMDERIQNRIFEPFFTTKDVGEGTGLGLSVIHGIVRSHDGEISVESSQGEGTTVAIYLPPQEGVGVGADIIKHQPQGGNEKILFVDDEELVGDMADLVLRRLGYRVTICKESDVALGLFQQDPEPWDLVITDQTMPGLTGLELADSLREIRSEIPVLLITGYSERVNAESIREHKISEMVYKPFNVLQIASAIRRVLSAAN